LGKISLRWKLLAFIYTRFIYTRFNCRLNQFSPRLNLSVPHANHFRDSEPPKPLTHIGVSIFTILSFYTETLRNTHNSLKMAVIALHITI
jgi:hypothetical protein